MLCLVCLCHELSHLRHRDGTRAHSTCTSGSSEYENLKLKREEEESNVQKDIYTQISVTCPTARAFHPQALQAWRLSAKRPYQGRNITPPSKKACPQALERSYLDVRLGLCLYASIPAIRPSTSGDPVGLGRHHGIPSAFVGYP